MSTPAPEGPTLADVVARLDALALQVQALPEQLMLTPVPGLDDGTKRQRPVRGILAVLNNRGAAIRAQLEQLGTQVAELQRTVDGGPVDQP